jgi:hypothetical protein
MTFSRTTVLCRLAQEGELPCKGKIIHVVETLAGLSAGTPVCPAALLGPLVLLNPSHARR